MTAQQLITQNLDLWSSAVKNRSSAGRGSSKKLELYGIKKLRELILELAVRGLLVEQDPNDEPASELLKKIAAEKARLIKEGNIKKKKPLPSIGEDEKTNFLPSGWEFVRLNDLGEWGAGATPKRGNSELYGGAIPWFKSGELTGDYISESEETVTEIALKQASLRYNKPGDVLLAMYGATIGKTAILSVHATTNQAVCACTPFSGFSNIYLLTLLKAFRPRFIGMGAGGAQPNISREKIIATVIALPPEAEQHRIVAKVDELMTLCDQLEQQQENSISAHKTLVETLLSSLVNAAEKGGSTTKAGGNAGKAAAFSGQQVWARIAEHFDTLFTTEHSIDQLKQTILQLAVMGRLVPQDPDDEPASKLLERIASEKQQLIKDGKIKKNKPFINFDGLDDLKKPLPESWEWIKLADTADLVRGGSPRPAGDPKFYDGEIPFLKVGDVTRKMSKFVEGFNSTIKEAGLNKTRMIQVRTVLLSNSGATLGIPAICDFTATFNDGIAAFVEQSKYVFDEYLYLYLSTLSKWFLDIASQGQGQPNLNTDIIKTTWFALPPLPEQHRIVAKVDELMTLCDTLKANLQNAQSTQLSLTDSLVELAL